MSRFSRIVRLAPVAAMAWAAACGGSGKPAAGGTSAATASGSLPKTFTIAMIAKSSTNPVFLSGRVGAEAAAAEQSKKLGITDQDRLAHAARGGCAGAGPARGAGGGCR